MLVLEGLVTIPQKLKDIDQIILNIGMKFIDNLQMMNIFQLSNIFLISLEK